MWGFVGIALLFAGCATTAAPPQVKTIEWGGHPVPFHRVVDANHSYTLEIWMGQAPADVAKDLRKELRLKNRSPILMWGIVPLTTIPLFTPEFQFVQDGRQFTPNQFVREEFGVLEGETLTTLRAGTQVFGYIVLPPSWDYSRPVRVFHGVDPLYPGGSQPTELRLATTDS